MARQMEIAKDIEMGREMEIVMGREMETVETEMLREWRKRDKGMYRRMKVRVSCPKNSGE